MNQCNTVVFLKQVAAEGGEFALAARSAVGIIDDLNKTRPENKTAMLNSYMPYLNELVEHIYEYKNRPLLEHLVDEPDCELCANLIRYQVK